MRPGAETFITFQNRAKRKENQISTRRRDIPQTQAKRSRAIYSKTETNTQNLKERRLEPGDETFLKNERFQNPELKHSSTPKMKPGVETLIKNEQKSSQELRHSRKTRRRRSRSSSGGL